MNPQKLSELLAKREEIAIELIEAEGERIDELNEQLQAVQNELEYYEATLAGQVH